MDPVGSTGPRIAHKVAQSSGRSEKGDKKNQGWKYLLWGELAEIGIGTFETGQMKKGRIEVHAILHGAEQ